VRVEFSTCIYCMHIYIHTYEELMRGNIEFLLIQKVLLYSKYFESLLHVTVFRKVV
jgi:hypothetical protein